MAVRGELASLRDLRLEHSREPGDINSPLYRLLAALKPNSLRILHLKHGPIDEDAFGIILKQQGRSLRELIVFPKWNWLEAYGVHNPPPKPLVGLTPALSAQLADSCHNLEHAFFAVDRTLGDADECSVYRALSRLPRLETLHLELDVTVQRNEHFWEQGIEVYDRPRNIPQAELSRAISNAAVDASLARAIFNIISPHHQGLQRLSIGTSLKNGPYSRATVTSGFFRLLRWFAREWSCEWKCSSSGEPTVEIREGMSNLTEQSGEYWATLDVDIARGDVEGNERDEAPDLAAFVDAFADIWPRTTSRWWEEWRSLPLCPDQTQTEGN
ncbi:hypothetical protein QBC34DRAFT_402832 [Podospora aff. communis PSN243]|uniref:F-box domain-containing protein n=1 Tax=Podospora aff. communis PSN243 TaxID=3040156 RepID=A0AAV9GSC6_9PEZI|nr:hypothetical protein QBC34DRAFT_402832 [Podospora aff. communis PSN243]